MDESQYADQAFKKAIQAWEAAAARAKETSAAEWEQWRPDFASYDVVVSNYNGDLWPEPVQKAFEDYVKNGGGLSAFTRPTTPSLSGLPTTK